MGDVKPAFSDDPAEMTPQMKDAFLSKLVNGNIDAYNLLYGERMKRAWDEELSRVCKTFLAGKKVKGSRRSRGDTKKETRRE
jgi:hypothetical protein